MSDKVPLERVLDDMYTNSGVESSARDYYYHNYATESEREEMDREDKIMSIIGKCFIVLFILSIIFSIISSI